VINDAVDTGGESLSLHADADADRKALEFFG